MKQFFKFMFASMLGTFLTLIISFILFILIIGGAIMASSKPDTSVPRNAILRLTLDAPIPERSLNNPFGDFGFGGLSGKQVPGLYETVNAIRNAKSDSNIKGILLDLGMVPSGMATVEEIRNALLDFKKSGKFIVAYSELYSQKAYYLATVANKVYMNPEGTLDFRGIGGEVMFMKGLMEKLDVQIQVIRHGKFKSAVEPFILDKMSQANKEQTLTYINSLWKQMVVGISQSRGISEAQLNKLADNLSGYTPEVAVKEKMVDQLIYKDQLLQELRTRLNIKNDKDINSITLGKYVLANEKNTPEYSKDKIAIIFASGDIVSGNGDEGTIGSERISKAIRKARLDNNVKAIVLRVNSPGGSALASDVIWREMVLAKKAKPVVVSMGDVAASGGYYISCAASKVFADPNTITGSIGVFGIIPNFQKTLQNKLGITFDKVTTNKHSDFITVTRPLDAEETAIMQGDIERIYKSFIGHVAEGRNTTPAAIDSIGQGRVWSGVDAKRLNLIDEFGGLNNAVDAAAKLAKLSKYNIQTLPAIQDPFTKLIEQLTGDYKDARIQNELGEYYGYFTYLRKLAKAEKIQARLPFEMSVY
jgi:protease-4